VKKVRLVAKRILIFPAGMPRSLSFLERALAEGQSVIGASSLGHDPVREQYPNWTHLPYVTAPEFIQALQQVITDYDIDGIFTPNPVVWDYLNRFLPQSLPAVRLINGSPVDNELAPYRKALQFGNSVATQSLELAAKCEAKQSISELEIAAIFRHADSIPGMCDHEKIRALCEIFRYSPVGDIVEIGSWWGKSAFVLLRLAQCYRIGRLLCVDPWSNEHLIQNDEKGLVDRVPICADEALTVFQLNLLPYANGAINYLRLPSIKAAVEYRHGRTVSTQVFGNTKYSGNIALLHIDGNHSYENAQADVASWSDLVIPGGWIVIDDYIWPYGDGPQRVGDDFLRKHQSEIACSFVIGSALFIQRM
jgi:hypothetical protein